MTAIDPKRTVAIVLFSPISGDKSNSFSKVTKSFTEPVCITIDLYGILVKIKAA